jgi:hypothetical protein
MICSRQKYTDVENQGFYLGADSKSYTYSSVTGLGILWQSIDAS